MDNSATMPTVTRVFNVVGFAGSLRRGSYNRALLRAATELAPAARVPSLHGAVPGYGNRGANCRRIR